MATTQNTTTTTIPSSTTTTVVSAATNSNFHDIGFASVSLSDNTIQTILKGLNNSNSICGTPYYNNLANNVLNYFDNGANVQSLNLLSNVFHESSAITQITSITNEEIIIQIQGNGDENFNFFLLNLIVRKLFQ